MSGLSTSLNIDMMKFILEDGLSLKWLCLATGIITLKLGYFKVPSHQLGPRTFVFTDSFVLLDDLCFVSFWRQI